jgi:hypothetical protein
MIECPHCGNDNPEELFQHDSSLAGFHDYGRDFMCLKCRRGFHVKKEDAEDEMVIKWPDV